MARGGVEIVLLGGPLAGQVYQGHGVTRHVRIAGYPGRYEVVLPRRLDTYDQGVFFGVWHG